MKEHKCQVRVGNGTDFTGGYGSDGDGDEYRVDCGRPAHIKIDLSEIVDIEPEERHVWMCDVHDRESRI
jgi:hypothetical protein